MDKIVRKSMKDSRDKSGIILSQIHPIFKTEFPHKVKTKNHRKCIMCISHLKQAYLLPFIITHTCA